MALLYLAASASHVEPAYNRLWAQELFYSAFQLPRNWNRLAYEKNALEALSETDPILALQLFGQMDEPIPPESGNFPEDVRAFAAQRVFLAYWKRRGVVALDEIQARAQHLGDTGQYPYVAMIPIIRELAQLSENRSQALFNEAITYFSRGSSFDSAKPDFLQLLNSVWDTLPSPLKHEAMDVAVHQLTAKSSQNADTLFRGKSSTKSKTVEFTDRDVQLLFELLPKVREVDEEWAKRLANQTPSLASAVESGGVKHSDNVMLQGASSAAPAPLAGAQARLVQRRTLTQVQQIAALDPEAAFATSQSLTDPELQATALADVAAGFARKDRVRASKLVSEANGFAAHARDNPGKVMALFAIVKADHALNDQTAMQDAWNQAFDLGQELFQQDSEVHPGRLAYQTACFDNLRNLAEFAAKVNPPMVLQALRGVRNQLLQTYLGISAADGISQYAQVNPVDGNQVQ